jgi:hypothetical protein
MGIITMVGKYKFCINGGSVHWGIETDWLSSCSIAIYVRPYVMTTGSAMVSNQGFNTAAIESLSVLSETMQLSPLGLHALESLDGRDSVLFRLLFWVSFFFTNGIVLYSYKRKCEKAYRVTSTRPNT